LGQQVVVQLRALIITGKLRAGTHLVEAQLSERFRVSRGPIRDALAQLEAEGLVEGRRRGAFVVGLSMNDIDELYSLRETMEVMAMRLGAQNGKGEQWDIVKAPLARMREAVSGGDHNAFARADLEFHSTLYDLAGHRRLRQIWKQYEPTFAVLLSLTTAEDVDLHPSYESHLEIHDQMKSGKIAEATVSMQEHLLGSRTRLVSAYARARSTGNPDGSLSSKEHHPTFTATARESVGNLT